MNHFNSARISFKEEKQNFNLGFFSLYEKYTKNPFQNRHLNFEITKTSIKNGDDKFEEVCINTFQQFIRNTIVNTIIHYSFEKAKDTVSVRPRCTCVDDMTFDARLYRCRDER